MRLGPPLQRWCTAAPSSDGIEGLPNPAQQGHHRPRRADVRTAVRHDALLLLGAVVQSAVFGAGTCAHALPPVRGEQFELGFKDNPVFAVHRDQRRDLRHHRAKPAVGRPGRARSTRSRPAQVKIRALSCRSTSTTPNLDLIGGYSYIDVREIESGEQRRQARRQRAAAPGVAVRQVPPRLARPARCHRRCWCWRDVGEFLGRHRYAAHPGLHVFEIYDGAPTTAVPGACRSMPPRSPTPAHRHLPVVRRSLLRHGTDCAEHRDVPILRQAPRGWANQRAVQRRQSLATRRLIDGWSLSLAARHVIGPNVV